MTGVVRAVRKAALVARAVLVAEAVLVARAVLVAGTVLVAVMEVGLGATLGAHAADRFQGNAHAVAASVVLAVAAGVARAVEAEDVL
jgi:hypothetical protein